MGYRCCREHDVFELLREAVVRRCLGRHHGAIHAQHEIPYVASLEHGPLRARATRAAGMLRVGDVGVCLQCLLQEAQDPCTLGGPCIAGRMQRLVQHRHIEHVEAGPLQEVAAHVREQGRVRHGHEAEREGGQLCRHGWQPRHVVVRA